MLTNSLSLVSITRQMPRPRAQKQSDYKVEQSSFTLIALFWLEIGRCRGRNWLNGNQALWSIIGVNNHWKDVILSLKTFLDGWQKRATKSP